MMQSLLLFLSLAAFILQAVAQPESRNTSAASTGFWYETIKHNGISPTIANGKSWTVFRNVKDYGAKGDGTTDDTAAIQKAIDDGGRATGSSFGMTGQPALVYFPAGTYSIKSTLNNRVGGMLVGDPTNRPSIKASSAFTGTYLLVGHDTRYTGLTCFFHGIKNLILDTTAIPAKSITILEWGVSQANQLSNVMFNMAVGSGHLGLTTPGECPQLLYNDLQFVGGSVGLTLGVTQAQLKNVYFNSTTTFFHMAWNQLFEVSH